MVNQLVSANSPYLLQHMNNPVEWFPWGELALEKAKQEEKPIFLSIGYSACHWCHVMAHESFEDKDIAAIMNRYFVNIKVDREERPDLDNIYMSAVVAMTGQGGWPMSVFLTPDGKPFYGGTYFPPTPWHGLPAFRDVLLSVARVWTEDREKIVSSGDQITKTIQAANSVYPTETESLTSESLDQAALALAQSYDWKHGGWGKAPKFPQPMAIEFLLRRAVHGDRLALDIAVHALNAMAKGGMYDVIGGGFARYSTDDQWLIPHFEKMLYDNALLASVYLHAYLLTRKESFRRVCESTLDFIAREMTDPSTGAFYSSLDADSEGEEGKYYLWTYEEIRHVIDDPLDFDLFVHAYDVSEQGNFEGKNVLQRSHNDDELSVKFQINRSEVTRRLSHLQEQLLAERSLRIRPGTDDKALASWNGMVMVSFSEAARYLDREDYGLMAIRNGTFIASSLLKEGQLYRSYRNNKVAHQAYLEDYASLCIAFLSLYQTDPDPLWFNTALQLAQSMIDHFVDLKGGFFDTGDDQASLIARPKDIQDNATPSGNALAATALLYLSALHGVREWRNLVDSILLLVMGLAKQYPLAFSQWLCAIDLAISAQTEIAILGNPDLPETKSLFRAVWSRYRPHTVVASASFPPPDGVPKLLENRPLRDNLPTVYLCHSFVCNHPVNTPAELLSQLDNLDASQW